MLVILKKIQLKTLISILFFLCFFIGTVHVINLFKDWVTDSKTLPIRSLVLTGKQHFVSIESINEILLKQQSKLNFFTLDINEIQHQLETLPWIYSVAIRKEWPDKIKVHIVEQTIVAKWNNKVLLNQFGEIVNVSPDSIENEFVSLFGGEKNTSQTLDIYYKTLQLLKVSQFEIVELTNDKRNSTTILLNNGILLKLGTEQKLDRVQRFLAVFPLIKKRYNAETIDYIDLRYDTGIAIGWKKLNINETNISG